MTIDQLIDSLTIDDALAYDALVDKVVWIQDTLLDPNDLDRKYWKKVERRLMKILKTHKPWI